MTTVSPSRTPEPDQFGFSGDKLARMRRVRRLKDTTARVGIGVGGVSVIIAILLIFFYLLWETLPLFQGAEIQESHHYSLPAEIVASGQPRALFVEEQMQLAARLSASGALDFMRLADGSLVESVELPTPANLTAVVQGEPSTRMVALGYDDGSVLLARIGTRVTFPNDVKTVLPEVTFPLGESPIELLDESVHQVAFHLEEDSLSVAAQGASGLVRLVQYELAENFLTEELELEEVERVDLMTLPPLQGLHINTDGRWIVAIQPDGVAEVFDGQQGGALHSKLDLVDNGLEVTTSGFLMGGISLMVGDSSGSISQWFMVRDEHNKHTLTRIRDFTVDQAPVTQLVTEHRRKGFVAIDANRHIGIYSTTAHRRVIDETLPGEAVVAAAISPRGNGLLMENSQGEWVFYDVDNEHPDISWSSLWQKVWYESYPEPDYVWQSSSAVNDFEPKFSLMPLAFGTLKAAFYAMLMSIPLAICGAIYTAYFMAPGMRQLVKPTIEMMEALPTVILGFLAGLWLAPLVENALAGIFMILLLMPIAFVASSLLWTRLPANWRHRIPDGWHPLLLVPVVLLVVALSMSASDWVEITFFGGSLPHWLSNEAGIPFDQRNALVVGLAMGFAVIPTIFSIAEDALFAVPKHLTFGSLALGATPWQTLVRVILPTASPGIFSAVMIGFGRAVGETMIVLMATGNTPVMNWNIFEGFRTLSANIAVEMPEAEVASTHFRILFLAALVLFVFTFLFNTSAELIRHRLRKRYGTL